MMLQAGSGTSVESGGGAVRGVTTVLAVVTVVTVGSSGPNQHMLSPFLAAGLVVALSSTVELVHRQLASGAETSRREAVFLHSLDLVFFVVTSIAVQVYVVEAGWALLVIPMVLASIRFGDRAVAATWLAGSGAHLAALQIPDVGLDSGAAAAIGQLGVLLAVAGSLALLARWLQEGWSTQADLTHRLEGRLKRLTVVEKATRAMRVAPSSDLVIICLHHVIHLGFEAATATRGTQLIAATGVEGTAPADTIDDPPSNGEIHITTWTTDHQNRRHSARIGEPLSGLTITAWSNEPISDDSARALVELIATTTNAIEAAIHLDRVRHQATHDPLTNLANRREFNHQLERAAAQPQPIAVLYIDLDQFKAVNDTHGHDVGDKLLVIVARRLQRAVGDHGLVGRVGGDEFVILLTGPPAHHAHRLGQDLTSALQAPLTINGLKMRASASIGVADDTGPVDPTDLTKRADAAAYKAKAAQNRHTNAR